MKYPLYCIQLPSQYLLTSTFMRFQEHYESANPRFRERGFSVEEFQDWYALNGPCGYYSYHEDWVGFNLPSKGLKALTNNNAFGSLTRKEKWLIDKFQNVSGDFYVIGTYQDDLSTACHEIAHGLFNLYPEYAQRVESYVEIFDFSDFKDTLREQGYTEAVLVDEINAYLLTGLSPFLLDHSKDAVEECEPILRVIFSQTFGFDIANQEQAGEFVANRVHHIDGHDVAAIWAE